MDDRGFDRWSTQTRDPDVMAHMMTTTLGAVDMSVIDPKTAFLSLETAMGESLSTLDLQMSFRGRSSLDGLARDDREQTYSVVYVDDGRGRVWNAQDEEFDIYRTVLYPDWVDSEFDGCRAKVVSISRSRVREYARRLAGADAFELRFTGFEPRSPRFHEQWVAIRTYLLEAIRLSADDPGMGMIRGALTDLIAATVLAAFPNTLTDYLDRHDARPLGASTAVRRAVIYIDENLRAPLSLADVVAASGMSVRGLQSAFRRAVGVSPMQYVRQARLAGARRDLLISDVFNDTVAAIARRWGFVHLSRFSAVYRDTFDEYPSETLRRRGVRIPGIRFTRMSSDLRKTRPVNGRAGYRQSGEGALMTNVEVKYGGEAYTVIGRDIDDVQAEIDDILARRSHGWLTAYDGRGIRAPYRLLIAEGVSVSLALAARDE